MTTRKPSLKTRLAQAKLAAAAFDELTLKHDVLVNVYDAQVYYGVDMVQASLCPACFEPPFRLVCTNTLGDGAVQAELLSTSIDTQATATYALTTSFGECFLDVHPDGSFDRTTLPHAVARAIAQSLARSYRADNNWWPNLSEILLLSKEA